MLNVAQYGWEPATSEADSLGRLKEAVTRARDDADFGLPEWVRSERRDELRARPLVVLGVNEFTHGLLACMPPGRIVAIVDDHQHGQLVGGVECISSDDFQLRFYRSREILAVDCARFGAATLHFRALAQRSHAPVVNFEQAVRLLAPGGVDYRIADHLPSIVEHAEAYLDLDRELGYVLSRVTLRHVLLFHLTTCREMYRGIERPYHTLYFRSGVFTARRGERFVDCGASIGESISGLLEVTGFNLDRAWLFEPDRLNIKTLTGVIEKFERYVPGLARKITLIPSAVGSHAGRVAFRHVGGHGGNVVADPRHAASAEVAEVDMTTIDASVDAPPTLIKMDVEGFELETLKGAAACITAHRPRLCVSAYHRPGDLIELTRYVLSLRPDYRVDLRHHTTLRWDTCLYFH